MFTKSPIDAVTKVALTKAEAVLAAREKIAVAIKDTGAEIARIQATLEEKLKELATEQAEAALAASDSPETESAVLKEVGKLKLRLEALPARVHGLQAKLPGTDSAILEAEAELTAARKAWRAGRVADFRERYLKAVETFAPILREGQALGAALGASTLSRAMNDIALLDPADPARLLVKMKLRRSATDSGYREQYSAYEDDAAAREVFAAHVPVRTAADKLARIAAPIRARREAEQGAALLEREKTAQLEERKRQREEGQARAAREYQEQRERDKAARFGPLGPGGARLLVNG